jgi:hypothetical protein
LQGLPHVRLDVRRGARGVPGRSGKVQRVVALADADADAAPPDPHSDPEADPHRAAAL